MANEKEIEIWSYYRYPPFVTAQNEGLSYDFVRLLNQVSKGKYRFRLYLFPRKRIDRLLASGKQGVVMFVHWSWMRDQNKTRYFWGPAILSDRNEILSSSANPVEFDGTAESLYGMRFGGILGRRYVGLMPAMAEHKIQRFDVRFEKQNIQKILQGRIDVTSMPETLYRYLNLKMNLDKQIHQSQQPLFAYTRHLMVTSELRSEQQFLVDFVEQLPNSLVWQRLLAEYGLSQEAIAQEEVMPLLQ